MIIMIKQIYFQFTTYIKSCVTELPAFPNLFLWYLIEWEKYLNKPIGCNIFFLSSQQVLNFLLTHHISNWNVSSWVSSGWLFMRLIGCMLPFICIKLFPKAFPPFQHPSHQLLESSNISDDAYLCACMSTWRVEIYRIAKVLYAIVLTYFQI